MALHWCPINEIFCTKIGKIYAKMGRKLSYPAPDDGDTCVESCPSNETPEILSPNNDRRWWIEVTNSAPQCCQGGLICQHTPAAILPLTFCSATITLGLNLVIWHSILVKNRHFQHHCLLNFPRQSRGCGGWRWGAVTVDRVQLRTCYSSSGPLNCANCGPPNEERRRGN